jgi:hypothetical protein
VIALTLQKSPFHENSHLLSLPLPFHAEAYTEKVRVSGYFDVEELPFPREYYSSIIGDATESCATMFSVVKGLRSSSQHK